MNRGLWEEGGGVATRLEAYFMKKLFVQAQGYAIPWQVQNVTGKMQIFLVIHSNVVVVDRSHFSSGTILFRKPIIFQ